MASSLLTSLGLDPVKTRRGALLAFLVYVAYRFQRFASWQKRMAKSFPGPPVSLVTGNLGDMVKAGGFTEQLFIDLHGQYGDIIRFFMFPNMLNMSIADPDIVSELYKKARERPPETYMFLWYLGKENLLFQHGPIVKEMRLIYGKMITSREALDKLHAVSMREFRAQVEKVISPADAARPFDLFGFLGPAIYDVMGQWLFDAPWLATEIGQKVYAIHKHLIEDVNRWLLYPVGPIFHPGFIEYLLSIREWRRLVGSLLEERAKEMRENPRKYETDESSMTMILRAKRDDGKPFFSRERAISTMCGFLNGAYDTTHATAYWMTFHLAKYPETQTKLLDEFSRLNIPSEPTVDDLRKCEYLHAFVMESMRVRSTVPVNQRVNVDEDMELGGYVIPKGTNVNVPNGVIAKDERWFGKNPEMFRPERFLGDSPEAERARKSWMAFGGHSRMCVGFTAALVEVKVLTHVFVTRAQIALEDPNYDGAIHIEAGVNQPVARAKFVFKQRDLRKVREEENLRWWLSQVEGLEKYQATPNVAPTA